VQQANTTDGGLGGGSCKNGGVQANTNRKFVLDFSSAIYYIHITGKGPEGIILELAEQTK
jgi:hypothetical protein